MIWEGSKRNQLILGTPFLATAGAVLNYFGNHLSFGHIRQDIFFPSVNFRSVPRINSILLPTFDEYGAEEETNGAPNLFHKIRIFTPKDSELKGDQSIEEKLERTMKLFPKALVFKDDVRDDYGATTPPQESTTPENGEAKGILCPSATLHHD
ncbi:unnamed protein product [Microthlaspi erraticum]|uniref:Uncharacterized protein n=1 Tax=Microthlaspi erraticum TaxID=1685480 RepID=A0A6D2J869_9BRAS|nr:unnamed protein product [Microthlaspi erraticum]